jgi:glycyl-tRNA synthetase beta chain
MRLLLEIGVEEMPAALVDAVLEAFAGAVATAVNALAPEAAGGVRATATPRRLVAEADGLPASEPRTRTWVRGPSLARGRTPDGGWTPAALGFARAQGVAVEALEVREEKGEPYLFAARETGGRPAADVLAAALPEALGRMRLPRSMRWGQGSPRFVRPVRWIVCLLDEAVVPFRFAGVESGRVSRGLRYREPERIEIPSAADYAQRLTAAGIQVDRAARRALVRRLVAEAAGEDEPLLADELLAELTDIVESPAVVRGSFPAAFLELPEPVLTTTMIHHQRFVPLTRGGRLVNAFVAVLNGGDPDVVRAGNERVLRARLADASFFFQHDRRRPLAAYLDDLERITYLAGAGTLGDRARRLEALAGHVAAARGADPATVAVARRAGLLHSADRATEMVRELPELGGTMGAIYARLSGEPEAVAVALAESVLPTPGGDRLPSTVAGWAVALADRLDHVAAGFAAGLAPKGSADPYGLRRAAIGALRLLRAAPVDLGTLLAEALRPLGALERHEEAMSFFRPRLVALMAEAGIPEPVAEAVAEAGFGRVDEAWGRATALAAALAAEPEVFARARAVFRRAKTLAQPGPVAAEGEEEERLRAAVAEAERRLQAARAAGDWGEALAVIGGLAEPLDRFFREVLVMAPDPGDRARRQALLAAVVRLAGEVADLAQLPESGS